MNTQSNIPLVRLKRAKQTPYNPLSGIADPTQMIRKLDAFGVGYLKEAVNIWDSLEQRDDLVRAVASKRKKAVGRQGWTVLIHESLPADRRADLSRQSFGASAEAQTHAAALEHFYTNLRCENTLDPSERGGLARKGSSRLAVLTSKLLCRPMMDSIGKRQTAKRFAKPVVQISAVHEIVWSTNAAAPLSQTSSQTLSDASVPSAAQDLCDLRSLLFNNPHSATGSSPFCSSSPFANHSRFSTLFHALPPYFWWGRGGPSHRLQSSVPRIRFHAH